MESSTYHEDLKLGVIHPISSFLIGREFALESSPLKVQYCSQGRWWWCALNDYLAIAQFVRGHRSAGNNLSCHQMFRSVTIHLKWIFFLIFKHSAKSQVASAVSQKINFFRKMRRLTNFITKLLQLFILDQIPANKWHVARLCTKRTEKAFKNRWEDN